MVPGDGAAPDVHGAPAGGCLLQLVLCSLHPRRHDRAAMDEVMTSDAEGPGQVGKKGWAF